MKRHQRFDEPTSEPGSGPGFPGRGDRYDRFAGTPRGRGGGRGRGRGDGFGPGYGRHGGFGPGFGPPMFGRGPKRGRGDVRAAIIALLAEEPMHGYQIITELTERSGGVWRPSPGSVYPALQLLADEGLIRGETREGGTVYELTDTGRKHIDEHREQLGSPWEHAGHGVPDGARELMHLAMQVGIAARQVTHAGNEAQTKAAAEILTDARRKLYGILAEE